MSIAQAFNAFTNGGTSVIAPQWVRGDPVAISQIMLDEQIGFTIYTPSEYLTLAAYEANALRQWMPLVAGDHDMLCTSVGKAIPNTCIYIVDRNRNLLPAGFEGEICIGGYVVARGYLDAAVSSAKFIRDPFATSEDTARDWTHMFMAGDKRCLRENGSLVFLGRIDGDFLVKLRDLRIELNKLRLIWRDVQEPAAGSANIMVHTDFFTVSGSSLLLVRLQNALKEKMGVQTPLQHLYQASTFRYMGCGDKPRKGTVSRRDDRLGRGD
ncbi:hypothetical protein DL769_004927 [Monosporascus sp. CRB-8-3]|nr:hypothetical protein DL769_004927 [Monosporascus sp. CRB-8-3]